MFAFCCPKGTTREEFELERAEDEDTDDAGGDTNIPTGSVLSQSTMEKLAAMPGDLQGVEDGVAEIEDLVAGLEAGNMDSARLGELKLVMALFDQRASELLLQGTAGLSKEAKDEQRRRLNALFARIEAIFNSIRQQQPALRSVRSGGPAPTSTTTSVPMSSVSSADSAESVPTSTTKSVPAVSVKPPAASVKPPAASVKPPTASAKPPAASSKPPAASAKPPMASAKPPAASTKPPAASVKPPAASAKSEAHSERKNFAAAGRQFSMVSEEALKKLANTQSDLDSIEARASELLGSLTGPEVDGIDMLTLASMKTELTVLETRADRLECEGIDFIYTGELVSGKDTAKDTKKQQLQRLESLLTRFEEGFDILKKRQAALRA